MTTAPRWLTDDDVFSLLGWKTDTGSWYYVGRSGGRAVAGQPYNPVPRAEWVRLTCGCCGKPFSMTVAKHRGRLRQSGGLPFGCRNGCTLALRRRAAHGAVVSAAHA